MATYDVLKKEADERQYKLTNGEMPWIRIGTEVHARAAGAIDVLESFKNELSSRNIDAIVQKVGSLGISYAEPIVDIKKPGMPRLFFANVEPSDIPNIIDSYLIKDEVPLKNVLGSLGETEVEGIPNLNEIPGIKYQQRIALRNAGHNSPDDIYQYLATGGYEGLNKAITSMDRSLSLIHI